MVKLEILNQDILAGGGDDAISLYGC